MSTGTGAAPVEIRGLTLRRPWAACIASGMKTIENRGWKAGYRGVLAIHSASGPFEETALFSNAVLEALSRAPGRSFRRGVIVATARLTDCHQPSPTCTSPWCDDKSAWHWELTDIRALDDPIPAKGALSLWRPAPEIHTQLAAHLETKGTAHDTDH